MPYVRYKETFNVYEIHVNLTLSILYLTLSILHYENVNLLYEVNKLNSNKIK